jgi:hypothetical protein
MWQMRSRGCQRDAVADAQAPGLRLGFAHRVASSAESA